MGVSQVIEPSEPRVGDPCSVCRKVNIGYRDASGIHLGVLICYESQVLKVTLGWLYSTGG